MLEPVTEIDVRDVGQRVRRERDKAGLSLSQLAETSGLTKAYLVKLENQGGNPTLSALNAIASALEITIADLVGSSKLVLDEQEPADIPASLQAYANEAGLSGSDIRMLASIKWRRNQRPQSTERWRFIHQSLRASQTLEKDDGSSN
jgi:transcriptional regulator with XRE-family HTH domain